MSLTSSGPEHVVQFDQSRLQIPYILNENPTYIPWQQLSSHTRAIVANSFSLSGVPRMAIPGHQLPKLRLYCLTPVWHPLSRLTWSRLKSGFRTALRLVASIDLSWSTSLPWRPPCCDHCQGIECVGLVAKGDKSCRILTIGDTDNNLVASEIRLQNSSSAKIFALVKRWWSSPITGG